MFSGSKKGNQIYYPFYSKSPGKWIPSKFPSRAPTERDTHLQGIFTSLLIYLFLSVPQSPVRAPPPCSLTGSPRTGILCHQSHWSVYSFIHSCMSAGVPKSSPPTQGEKHKVAVHGTPSRQKAYIQWGAAWFPKGTFTTIQHTYNFACDYEVIPYFSDE
jgi:hypothetical protein